LAHSVTKTDVHSTLNLAADAGMATPPLTIPQFTRLAHEKLRDVPKKILGCGTTIEFIFSNTCFAEKFIIRLELGLASQWMVGAFIVDDVGCIEAEVDCLVSFDKCVVEDILMYKYNRDGELVSDKGIGLPFYTYDRVGIYVYNPLYEGVSVESNIGAKRAAAAIKMCKEALSVV
jgi:hypothetical protein